MRCANRELGQASGNTFSYRGQRGTTLLAFSASLGLIFCLSACGGSSAGNSADGNAGGESGLPGSGSTEEVEIDSDRVVDAAEAAAALSDDDLSAELATVDLENQVALSEPSGLITELGNEATTRAAWASVGFQMKLEADLVPSWAASGTQQTQSISSPLPPGVRVQADGGGGVNEAFGAGWLGGSLFNAFFVETAINDYNKGKSGINMGGSPTGDVKATAGLTDTLMTLDATAEFALGRLSATIKTHSGIPCPDVTGLITINSSLEVAGKADNAYQRARFSFELIVDVDDDAHLTGRNQLTSKTEMHTADSSKGNTTDSSVNVSITEFADGHFGDAKGSYQGMDDAEMTRWLNASLFSGEIYRRQLLPNLQKMLDAGRCVTITVEPSAGPTDLDPSAKVDLLTKPRAKSSSSRDTTGGTVQATIKIGTGGAIAEAGDKVPADATFHYTAPSAHSQSETLTFEARSRRGTGKLDYTLTTSPHAE